MATTIGQFFRSVSAVFVVFSTILFLSGCSAEQDDDEKGGSIDRATKKVADAAVDYIQTPVEKAEAVKEIEETRRSRLEEQTR